MQTITAQAFLDKLFSLLPRDRRVRICLPEPSPFLPAPAVRLRCNRHRSLLLLLRQIRLRVCILPGVVLLALLLRLPPPELLPPQICRATVDTLYPAVNFPIPFSHALRHIPYLSLALREAYLTTRCRRINSIIRISSIC